MKPSSPLVALVALARAPAVGGLECGHWYSNPCLCESDSKYCADGENGATDDILAQHPLWEDFIGFFEFEIKDLLPPGPGSQNLKFLEPTVGFLNNTIDGSRMYRHVYKILRPNPNVNCTLPSWDGGPDCEKECGHGCVQVIEGYSTSTPERDGTVVTTNKLQPSLHVPSFDGRPVPLAPGDFKQVPIDGSTLFGSAISGLFKITEVFTFTNAEKSQARSIEDVYMSVNGTSYLVSRKEWTYNRLDSAEAFLELLGETMEERRVREGKKPPVPMTSRCNQLNQETCPSEEDFCAIDPSCVAEAKYQEPDATLKAGPIAGIIIAVAVVLLGAGYLLHLKVVKDQAARNESAFARRIAETITLEGPERVLTPEALAEEFKKIDSDGNADGSIDRDELWKFVNSGKMGKMSEKDFNALFAALDTDGDGTVSFMEFSAYMGKCYGKFEQMKSSKSVKNFRSETTADAAVPEPGIQEEEENDEEKP